MNGLSKCIDHTTKPETTSLGMTSPPEPFVSPGCTSHRPYRCKPQDTTVHCVNSCLECLDTPAQSFLVMMLDPRRPNSVSLDCVALLEKPQAIINQLRGKLLEHVRDMISRCDTEDVHLNELQEELDEQIADHSVGALKDQQVNAWVQPRLQKCGQI